MKKCGFLCCLILLVCLAVPFKGIYAAERPTLTVEAVEANPGDEVRLAVSLSNNPGICAFRMAVNYDEGLTLTAVSDAKLYGDHMFGNDLNANPYILMWDESLKTKANTSNGALAYLTFKVDKDATFGTHKVWITYRTGDIYDLDLKDIDVDLVAGGVTLKNASVTATPTPVVTSAPTPVATSTPTPVPTNVSTPVPTRIPTPVVTAMPTPVATGYPTSVPTYGPTRVPTSVPTSVITSTPTSSPTDVSTNVPTTVVTVTPTPVATGYPTLAPTNTPTSTPTMVPTVAPTAIITSTPTLQPTGQDNNVTPTEAGNPDVTVTPAVAKPFTVTITDEYGQTVKYKVTPESGKKGSVAGKATVVSLKTSKKSIIIPDSVKIDGKKYNITAIGKNALKTNKKATKLQIGTNVTTIGKAAFKSLKKLKTITINSSKISVIGSSAFKGIATKAKIQIKAPKKEYKNIISLIKTSGIGEKVKFVRVK